MVLERRPSVKLTNIDANLLQGAGLDVKPCLGYTVYSDITNDSDWE